MRSQTHRWNKVIQWSVIAAKQLSRRTDGNITELGRIFGIRKTFFTEQHRQKDVHSREERQASDATHRNANTIHINIRIYIAPIFLQKKKLHHSTAVQDALNQRIVQFAKAVWKLETVSQQKPDTVSTWRPGMIECTLLLLIQFFFFKKEIVLRLCEGQNDMFPESQKRRERLRAIWRNKTSKRRRKIYANSGTETAQ